MPNCLCVKLWIGLCLLLALLLGGGCSARTVGRCTSKVIVGAGSLAAKTTVTTVKVTGHVASAVARETIHTSGTVITGVGGTAFVTFKDTATGIGRRVPYSEGLRLYAASESAKVQAGLAAFELVRNGVPILTARGASIRPGTVSDPLLRRGDVVRVSGQVASR